jgi:hypothetical protein
MPEIVVPDLVNRVADKLGRGAFGSFVGGIVFDENGVESLLVGTDNG